MLAIRKTVLLLALIAVAIGLFRSPPASRFSVGFRPPTAPSGTAAEPVYRTQFMGRSEGLSVHSPTIVEMENGNLRAFWFGGSREGAADVAIRSSVFDGATWSNDQPVIDRALTQEPQRRYVGKLGNPTVMRADDGRLMLFYVTASYGGWARAAINLIVSDDNGRTWSAPKRLITSPFMNVSTLVRSPPFYFDDGTIGLPVYHEFAAKFGELLRLDRDGTVLHKQRLSWGRYSLQPMIIPTDRDRAACFLRRAGWAPRKIMSLRTEDGGATWTPPHFTDQNSPSAPVAGVALDDGNVLIVFNNTTHERDNLALAITKDHGRTFRILHHFEKDVFVPDEADSGVSYPTLITTANGDFHLVYTYFREKIKHVHFNRAWLEQLR